jgi:hypothetical protein
MSRDEREESLVRLIGEVDPLLNQARLLQETSSENGQKLLGELVAAYQGWLVAAEGTLPPEAQKSFREQYEGNFFSSRIKKFLEDPWALNPVFTANPSTSDLFSKWLYAFAGTFRAPMLEQRRILSEALDALRRSEPAEATQLVGQFCRNYPRFVRQLQRRQRDRPGFAIDDEYDVQDSIHAVLRLWFDDVRPEEGTPSSAGKASRIDFLLKNETVALETKFVRKGKNLKELATELSADIVHYQAHQSVTFLVVLIYDPEFVIANPGGFESDLSKDYGGLSALIVVAQG